MSPEIIALLNGLPLHVILMIGIIVLWRENRALNKALIDIKTGQVIHAEMLESQNVELRQIKAQTNGLTQLSRHTPPKA